MDNTPKDPKEPKSYVKKFMLIVLIIFGTIIYVMMRLGKTNNLENLALAFLAVEVVGSFVLILVHEAQMSAYFKECKKIYEKEYDEICELFENNNRTVKFNQTIPEPVPSKYGCNFVVKTVDVPASSSILDSLPDYYDDEEDEDAENEDEEYVTVQTFKGEVKYTQAEWDEEMELLEEEEEREREEEEARRRQEEEERRREEEEEELIRQQEEEDYYWNYVKPALDEEYPDA